MGDLSPYCCWLRFSQNMSQKIVGRVTWQGLVKSPRLKSPYIYIATRLISSQPIYTLPASKKRNTSTKFNKSIFFYWMVHDSLHDGTFWSGVNIPSHPVRCEQRQRRVPGAAAGESCKKSIGLVKDQNPEDGRDGWCLWYPLVMTNIAIENGHL